MLTLKTPYTHSGRLPTLPTTGPARLRMSGTLLCARQDTRLTLSDFPLQQLEPLTRAMPVLEKAARAAKARSSGQGGLQPLAGKHRLVWPVGMHA